MGEHEDEFVYTEQEAGWGGQRGRRKCCGQKKCYRQEGLNSRGLVFRLRDGAARLVRVSKTMEDAKLLDSAPADTGVPRSHHRQRPAMRLNASWPRTMSYGESVYIRNEKGHTRQAEKN
jgi:hypothetical protein